ncbi:MAG: hypothetical protein EVB11_04955 [Winogradskyella sp.]|nr:MAG: hypothetical protein EVB11_04955 [Winogradskyella sp.]
MGNYQPKIITAHTQAEFYSVNYKAKFLVQVLSQKVDYHFLMEVLDIKDNSHVLTISSEKFNPSSVYDEFGLNDFIDEEDKEVETHFLCLFKDGQHTNYGDNEDWTDPRNFKRAALELIETETGEALKENIQLSEREAHLIKLLKQRLTTREIAQEFNLVPRSVDTLLRNLILKFGVKSKKELLDTLTELDDTDFNTTKN